MNMRRPANTPNNREMSQLPVRELKVSKVTHGQMVPSPRDPGFQIESNDYDTEIDMAI